MSKKKNYKPKSRISTSLKPGDLFRIAVPNDKNGEDDTVFVKLPEEDGANCLGVHGGYKGQFAYIGNARRVVRFNVIQKTKLQE